MQHIDLRNLKGIRNNYYNNGSMLLQRSKPNCWCPRRSRFRLLVRILPTRWCL